ncbi:MAG: DUF4139 domain-containing protein [Polyangiaceae bacterium]|nr:DUF4139 domain-containing protein [Polyangiaceae bacterium]
MPPILLESRVEKVRVFRSGALVRRVATIPPFSGATARVRFADLPVALDDASLRLETDSPATVLLDAAIGLDGAERTTTAESSDEREHDALRREEAALTAELTGIDAALIAIEQVHLPERPSGAEGEPPPDIDLDASLSFVTFKRERWELLAKRRRELERKIAHTSERRRVVAHRIELSSSSRLPRPDELRKSVVATARRDDPATGATSVAVEYFVPGARWAPAYVLRVDTKRRSASLELRAIVAQSSGEDWRDVELSLSTAEALRFHELPELTSLRLGRAQAAPKKRAWRAPPRDPVELFADFARALPKAERPPAPAAPAPREEPGDELDRATPQVGMGSPPMEMGAPSAAMPPSFAPQGFGAPGLMPSFMAKGGPPGAPPPAAAPMAMPMSMGMPAPKGAPPPRGGGGPMLKARRAADSPNAPSQPEPELEVDPRLLSYEGLRMPGFEQRHGKLRVASMEERYLELSQTLDVRVAVQIRQVVEGRVAASRKASQAPLPPLHVAPDAVDGFDYAHACASRADVPADGSFHSLPITTVEAPLVLRYVAVPRESQDVFRFVELDNPLEAPLLRGPCDVYFDRDFLLTADLATVAPRGKVRAGLGVDQAIKCARNTSFAEASAGLMGGSLALKHTIKIELANHRADAADVEVRERVPFVPEREEDIKLEVAAQPAWRPWEPPLGESPVKGAHMWRVSVEPGGRAELSATYVVKIPAKLELVGGNRRE